jgi:hypothetical protein
MTFATSRDVQVARVQAEAVAPSFARSFERASERRLLTLYDVVASRLSASFEGLAAAADEQLDVLNRVAELVGLEGLDVDEPLPDEASEALAQRVAWRSAARWAVLSLLWTLVERAEQQMTSSEWAQLAREHGGKRPRSRSSLPERDEPTALGFAADALVSSPAVTQGTGMAVLGVPVVIGAPAAGSVVANVVRPVALVETQSDWSATPIELSAGDRISLASGPLGFSLNGECEGTDAATLTSKSHGVLSPDATTRVVEVARGCALLFEG